MTPIRSSGNAFALLTALILAFEPSSAHAEITLKLAWDPNPETDVVGYRVGWTTDPGTLHSHFDTGSATTVAISGLAADTLYHFTVVAVNAAGLVSEPAPLLSHRTSSLAMPSVFDAWWSDHGLLLDSATEDPDGDGIANLLESLCGGDPWRADANDRGRIRAGITNGQWKLEYIVNRSVAEDPRLSHGVFVSTDGMSSWRDIRELSGHPGFGMSVEPDAAGPGLDRVRLCVPMDALGSSAVFARLRAALQE
jgi:hypothetical protein